MEKRFIFVILLLVLMIGIIITSAAIDISKKWQSSTDIQVKIDGNDISLQDAIDQGLLVGDGAARLTESTSSKPFVGHSFDEIWVSVSGNEMILKDAVSTLDLCGTTSPITTYTSSSIPDPVHLATEIEVNISGNTKSLQEAINVGDVLVTNYANQCINDDLYNTDSCNRDILKEDCDLMDGINFCSGGHVKRDEGTCFLGSCTTRLDTVDACVYDEYCSSASCTQITYSDRAPCFACAPDYGVSEFVTVQGGGAHAYKDHNHDKKGTYTWWTTHTYPATLNTGTTQFEARARQYDVRDPGSGNFKGSRRIVVTSDWNGATLCVSNEQAHNVGAIDFACDSTLSAALPRNLAITIHLQQDRINTNTKSQHKYDWIGLAQR